ncbi:MAG: L,D-transpeptidase [Candidatus Pacebacteria bacterium]|nr:L,D-transpeptidase [Candidatus Paceibacterota bacterium]
MKKIYINIAVSLVVVIGVIFILNKNSGSKVGSIPVIPDIVHEVIKPEIKPVKYSSVVLDSENPAKEATELIGFENLDAVLSLNRIDQKHFQKGMTFVYPDRYDDLFSLSSFPRNIPELKEVPKMMLISQEIQEFGAYEYGALVRFGGISTGKKSTPTMSKLFHSNWKGKEVISTSNDEWILKWNVNVDNFNGIGIHEYELPGYPASHSCVRLSASDAKWFYDWVDQWKLSDQDEVLEEGTPVLIFGKYGYDSVAPWKKLAEDPYIMTITNEDISAVLSPILSEI